MRNHNTVVNAEALICSKHVPATFAGHDAHHLLESLVAADAADDEHIAAANVRHGALRDLDKHGKHVLLQTETKIRRCNFIHARVTERAGDVGHVS